jgi:TonB-linked SusC/RagA family outer membrane protein
MKRLSLVLSMVCFAIVFAMAQRTVVGSIFDDNGEALIGASILAKGTSTGTVTDVNGKFSLSVPREVSTLVVSYTGYTTQEVALGASNVVDVRLVSGAQIDEVVVTALGIRRDKKALGYASTQIGSDQIASKPETDIARVLTGKSPGVVITNSSGLAGSGTKINVRGTSTISGNSQPLWVVDGVPINTASNENNDFQDGNVTPTRSLDLDPNNIENISVLRGLSATTLYGSAGRNGVVLVTTKTGSGIKGKKFTASISQSYNIVDAVIPEYQNKWSNGFDGDYGEFFSNWGKVFDGTPAVNPNNGLWWRHPYYEHRALFPDHPEFAEIDGSTAAKGYVPVAAPNNVKDFFQRGNSRTTSINAGIASDLGSFNVSFATTGEEGYIKNNELKRNNFSIGGTANLTKKFSLGATFSYINTEFQTPTVGAGTGSNSTGGASVFANLFYTPRNMDLMNWPYQNPLTGASVYYRNNNSITNPRWLLDNSKQASNTNRFMTTMSANYSILDWLKATYRIGIDNYNEAQEYSLNRGAVGFPTEAGVLATGLYRTTNGVNTIYDHSFFLSGQKNITSAFDLSANVGLNGRQDTYEQTGLESSNQVVFGLLSHRNFIDNNDRDFRNNNLNRYERYNVLGAFGDVTLGYNNFLYLNLQGRNDWASSHEKNYRSQFYPGVSVSFVPTQAIPGLESSFFNFMKLRAGYGTSANFSRPYKTRPFLALNANAAYDANGNVITLALPSLLANANLRPELQKEVEVGAEIRLLKNRISLDLSAYKKTASDQIVERTLDPSTGYGSTFINAGTITNRGLELGASVTPIKTRNIEWNVRANFTKNISKVTQLPEGSQAFIIGGFSEIGSWAIEGKPLGVIQGNAVVRDAQGRLVINSNGDYKITPDIQIIGDPNPDYLLSGFTDITVKGFTLAAQMDYVHGGDIFSFSAATLVGRGVAKELEDFNPELTVILPGVLEDGSPNNIPQAASGVFYGNTIIGGGPYDRGIFDATRVRLREVSLTYNVPAKMFKGSRFVQGATISANVNNVWFRAINTPKYSKVDADRTAFGTGNAQGFDFLGGPSARRMGINLRINF